jgi:acetylornithine deacetylase/succinyl-diaminopimelate desuccinylase-like protein
MNISGMHAGYAGRGFLAVIPNETTVKLDIWLVPDQDPEDILEGLKAHLQRHGFEDILVQVLYMSEPCQFPWDTDITSACQEASREIYGTDPTIIPATPGFGRHGPWMAKQLGLNSGVHTGIGGPMPCNQHDADEFIEVETFLKGISFAAAVIMNFAKGI